MIGDAQALGLAPRRGVRNCRVCGVMITITVGTFVAVWFMRIQVSSVTAQCEILLRILISKSRPRRKTNETNPRNEGQSQPGEGRPTPNKGGQLQVPKGRPRSSTRRDARPERRGPTRNTKKKTTSTPRKIPTPTPEAPPQPLQ